MSDRIDGKGVRSLSDDELREYLRLYRRASTDLALARTKSRNPGLVDFLNDLVARAYSVFYRAPRPAVGQSIVNALSTATQTIRRRRAFVFTAAAIFFGSWIFVFFVMGAVPQAKEILVGPQADKLFEGWKKGQFEQRSGSEDIAMNGMYASNNPRVAIVAGAVGAATFGVGSIYLLFQNGAMVGALSSEMNKVGKLDFLLSSIFPHGVPELSGAIVAGSAGLLLGWALINPGRRRRLDSLKSVGKDAVTLIVTSVFLMFIAAPIEAYFSFNPVVPGWLKTTVGAVSLVAWLTFWTSYGKSDEERMAIAPADEPHLPSVVASPR